MCFLYRTDFVTFTYPSNVIELRWFGSTNLSPIFIVDGWGLKIKKKYFCYFMAFGKNTYELRKKLTSSTYIDRMIEQSVYFIGLWVSLFRHWVLLLCYSSALYVYPRSSPNREHVLCFQKILTRDLLPFGGGGQHHSGVSVFVYYSFRCLPALVLPTNSWFRLCTYEFLTRSSCFLMRTRYCYSCIQSEPRSRVLSSVF